MPKRNRRRGPQAPKGRVKPIGPVFALAKIEVPVLEPLREKVVEEENEEGATIVVSRTNHPNKITIPSKLQAISAGNIGLKSVVEDVALTPAQRRPVDYMPDGDIRFPDQRQVTENKEWEVMQDPGTLIIVSGCLIRMAAGSPQKFDFRPNVWDVADPSQHQHGKLAIPHPQMS